jgi:hypothetical protein
MRQFGMTEDLVRLVTGAVMVLTRVGQGRFWGALGHYKKSFFETPENPIF